MANPLLKRLLGEALEDPVEHHLSTLGPGVPPAGRTYPEHPAPKFNDPADEEGREVQIGREMLGAIELLPPMARNDVSMRKLAALAQELIDMHTTQPVA